MRLLLPILLFLSFTALAAAAPHIEGSLHIDLEGGGLKGDLCLSFDTLPDPPAFLLNKGLNIVRIHNSKVPVIAYQGEHSSAGGEMVGEAISYRVTPENPEDLEDGFCVEYVGAFPVYTTLPKAFDFKGIIAFNGKTLRASEQTKWYPTPYQPESGRQTTDLSYDISLSCPKCQALYINGDRPVRASSHQFHSRLPRPLLIYAGDFEFEEIGGIHYLGGKIQPRNARELKSRITSIAGFYQGILKQPLRDLPQLLSFRQLQKRSGWAFITWPTIAFDGKRDFNSLFSSEGKIETNFLKTLSHEMAHYYFGALVQPVGPLYWFYLESTTEFLSALYARQFLGEEFFQGYLQDLKNRAERIENPKGLQEVRNRDEITDDYRYYLAPLWMLTLEARVGREKVEAMLRYFLSQGPHSKWDYQLFRDAAQAAGMDPQQLSRFEKECMTKSSGTACLEFSGRN